MRVSIYYDEAYPVYYWSEEKEDRPSSKVTFLTKRELRFIKKAEKMYHVSQKILRLKSPEK